MSSAALPMPSGEVSHSRLKIEVTRQERQPAQEIKSIVSGFRSLFGFLDEDQYSELLDKLSVIEKSFIATNGDRPKLNQVDAFLWIEGLRELAVALREEFEDVFVDQYLQGKVRLVEPVQHHSRNPAPFTSFGDIPELLNSAKIEFQRVEAQLEIFRARAIEVFSIGKFSSKGH